MPEREYLAIVPIHGDINVVHGNNLGGLQTLIEKILRRPRLDYPEHDFDSEIEIYNVRPLRRRERRFLEDWNCR